MAENLGNENMITRAAALGYQHDADLLRAWVSERMQMQTGEQLVSLLEAVDTQKSYQSSLLELAQEAVALETQRVNLHLTFKETL